MQKLDTLFKAVSLSATPEGQRPKVIDIVVQHITEETEAKFPRSDVVPENRYVALNGYFCSLREQMRRRRAAPFVI